MKPIIRKSVAEQTRQRLLEALAEGQWPDRMPSTRMLCETLQVSAHTLGRALEALVAEGHLISDGPKRRLRVAPAPTRTAQPSGSDPPAAMRVLCMSRDPLHQMPRMGLEFLSHLRIWLPQMDLRYHGITFDHCRKPRSAWDNLLELERPDHLLVLEGSVDVARWATGSGVPTVFLGGETGDTSIPMVGAAIGHLLLNLFGELLALGHVRICLPLFGRNTEFAAALRRLAAKAFDEAGVPFAPTYHLPMAARRETDVIWRVMDGLAAKAMPTAMIFLMWDEFIATQCYFMAKGLRIPDDVSVALIGGGGVNAGYRPKLTHSVYPAREAAELVARWILDGPPAAKATVHLPMPLVRGDSIAPPRSK